VIVFQTIQSLTEPAVLAMLPISEVLIAMSLVAVSPPSPYFLFLMFMVFFLSAA